MDSGWYFPRRGTLERPWEVWKKAALRGRSNRRAGGGCIRPVERSAFAQMHEGFRFAAHGTLERPWELWKKAASARR